MNRSNLRFWAVVLIASAWPGFMSAQIDEFNGEPHPMVNVTPKAMSVIVKPKLVQIKKPAPETTGLVLLGDQFVACYRHNKYAIIALRVKDGSWQKIAQFVGIPGPLAWDGEHLWVVDSSSKVIARYDEIATQPTRAESIPIPPAAIRTPPAISGMTWDGKALWLATDCGLCSGVFRIRPKDGKVLEAFFPKCMPRGLAYRPGSTKGSGELVMAAYIGQNEDSLLSTRAVQGNGQVMPDTLHFRRFRTIGTGTQTPRDPTSIAIQDKYAWVVDRQADSILAYRLPNTGVEFNGIKYIQTYLDSLR